MGTRHLICVVSDGDYKVAQYGQWDGYPSGQGAAILEFLHKEDLVSKLLFVGFRCRNQKTLVCNGWRR